MINSVIRLKYIMNTKRKITAKEALIEAAARLFAEKGYDAVSTRELAEASGVNLGAIQYHFGSKARLFVETMAHLWDEPAHQAPLALLLAPAKDEIEAVERVAQFVSAMLAYLLRDDSTGPCRMMFRETFSSASQDPEMLEALTTSFVKEITQPYNDSMSQLLRVAAPQASNEQVEWCARAIIAQCMFPATQRPFIERMQGAKLNVNPCFQKMVTEIVCFTLSVLDLSPAAGAAGREAARRFTEIDAVAG